jgi:hypothetical protein
VEARRVVSMSRKVNKFPKRYAEHLPFQNLPILEKRHPEFERDLVAVKSR